MASSLGSIIGGGAAELYAPSAARITDAMVLLVGTAGDRSVPFPWWAKLPQSDIIPRNGRQP